MGENGAKCYKINKANAKKSRSNFRFGLFANVPSHSGILSNRWANIRRAGWQNKLHIQIFFFFLCISPKMSAAPLRVMCSQRTAEKVTAMKAGKGAALMHPLEFQKCHLKIPSVAKSTLKLPDPEEHASGLTSNCCGPTTWDLVEIPDREQDKDRLSVPVSDHTVCHPFVVIAIIKYQKVLALFHR